MLKADWTRLEPEVTTRLTAVMEMHGEVTDMQGSAACWHSIAISLKRIADALDEHVDLHSPTTGRKF